MTPVDPNKKVAPPVAPTPKPVAAAKAPDLTKPEVAQAEYQKDTRKANATEAPGHDPQHEHAAALDAAREALAHMKDEEDPNRTFRGITPQDPDGWLNFGHKPVPGLGEGSKTLFTVNPTTHKVVWADNGKTVGPAQLAAMPEAQRKELIGMIKDPKTHAAVVEQVAKADKNAAFKSAPIGSAEHTAHYKAELAHLDEARAVQQQKLEAALASNDPAQLLAARHAMVLIHDRIALTKYLQAHGEPEPGTPAAAAVEGTRRQLDLLAKAGTAAELLNGQNNVTRSLMGLYGLNPAAVAHDAVNPGNEAARLADAMMEQTRAKRGEGYGEPPSAARMKPELQNLGQTGSAEDAVGNALAVFPGLYDEVLQQNDAPPPGVA